MNCQEARSYLYDMIDKETSEIDVTAVQSHVDKCPHCFDLFRLEGAIQDLIRKKIKNCEPQNNISDLKVKVLNILNKIDEESAA